MSKKNLKQEFDHWKKHNNQHGRQAFSRFIMLKFLEALQDVSNEFVFKGGNLLWHYINTPRETIDLDLATLNLKSHLEVKEVILKSFELLSDIKFELREFKELDGINEVGASVVISYATNLGQRNQFPIDIVYALPTDIHLIKSTIANKEYVAASIENIILDKVSAAYQFRSGNTRMKDFDDLWRIARSDLKIDSKKLSKMFKNKNLSLNLEKSWVSFLDDSWRRYSKSYKDIPRELEKVFDDINEWLKEML